jgi:hypothetical protein
MLTLGRDDFLHSSMKKHRNMASTVCPSQYPRFSLGRCTLLGAFLLRKSALQHPVTAFLYSALAWHHSLTTGAENLLFYQSRQSARCWLKLRTKLGCERAAILLRVIANHLERW